MRRCAAVSLCFLVAAPVPGAGQSSPASASAALIGDWQLHLGRTHYGPGVDRRRSERMTCTARSGAVHCVIRSVRSDGRRLTGRFTASLDGTAASVSGIPDVDQVQLRGAGHSVVDGTFLSRGAPVFGYRIFQSDDRRSLMVVSVDPTTRAVGSTIVVYDRR